MGKILSGETPTPIYGDNYPLKTRVYQRTGQTETEKENTESTGGVEKAFKGEWEPMRPRCCLMQSHWSFIWLSIIQQESSHPLWEESRYWTLHYLFDRGIAGLQHIPPERLLWDQALAVPLMTSSISWGLLEHDYGDLQFIHICCCVDFLCTQFSCSELCGLLLSASGTANSQQWLSEDYIKTCLVRLNVHLIPYRIYTYVPCSGLPLHYWSTHRICHCKWAALQ